MCKNIDRIFVNVTQTFLCFCVLVLEPFVGGTNELHLRSMNDLT